MTKEISESDRMDEDKIYGKYLTFNLDKEVFGMEVEFVTEIIEMQEITEVPETPTYVIGIINLRGKIIPVIDVRLKFKKEKVPYDDRTCIIVIDINDMQVGLIVDNVSEVVDIADTEISEPPGNKTGFDNNYIKKIGRSGNDVILILDGLMLLARDNAEILE